MKTYKEFVSESKKAPKADTFVSRLDPIAARHYEEKHMGIAKDHQKAAKKHDVGTHAHHDGMAKYHQKAAELYDELNKPGMAKSHRAKQDSHRQKADGLKEEVLDEGYKNVQHRERDEKFWRGMREAGHKTTGDTEYSHESSTHKIGFDATTNAWKTKHKKTGEVKTGTGGVPALHKALKEEVELGEQKSPVKGMTYAQYRKSEGSAPGGSKPKKVAVGVRVHVMGKRGLVKDIYDKTTSVGKKKFMHVAHDDGSSEHYRIDTSNHRVLSEEVLDEAKEPSARASHEEHHAYHEKMHAKYSKHKNTSSAEQEGARARQADHHKKMMDFHAGKTGPVLKEDAQKSFADFLGEAIAVDHSAYQRSHMKKAGGTGNHIISLHKDHERGHKEGEDYVQHNGPFAEAVKKAKALAKSKGALRVYPQP